MSTYTKNLKLFKYDPEVDGKEVFSISKALNDNWDKIDAMDVDDSKKMNKDFSNAEGLTEVVPVIGTFVNGTSGYRIWSDGYCEQWGRQNARLDNTDTITLLKKMKDFNYSIQAQLYYSSYSSNPNVELQVNNIYSSTEIKIGHWNGLADTYTWKVCGYLAEGEY